MKTVTTTEEKPTGGDPRFRELLDGMWALHCLKRKDYGSGDDPLANLRASAEIGIPAWKGGWLRAKDKVKRLDQYCVKGSLACEGVEDTLKDLAAYCLLVLTLWREEQEQVRGEPCDPQSDPFASAFKKSAAFKNA